MQPVRVLCLFTIMNRGGAETMCMNMYRHIDRTRVQFDFLVYYDIKGEYDDEISRLGGQLYRIPHPKNLIAHISEARRFFHDHKEYNIVHNHMQCNGAIICTEAKKAGVGTIIYHSHAGPIDSYTNDSKSFVKLLVEKATNQVALRCSTDYFACGNRAATAVPSGYQTHILFNGINIQKYQYNKDKRDEVRAAYGCGEKYIIGNVARLDSNKNQSFILDIIKVLREKNCKVELWLVGDGEGRLQLEEKIERLRLEGHVKLFGVRPDVDRLLQAMDVYVFPSIAEGLPLACIEAQAAGLPCVFSDGFDPETVVTENCRILSLHQSTEDWAKAIMSFKDFKRCDTSFQIKAAGYDIRDTVKTMQEFYISKSKDQ